MLSSLRVLIPGFVGAQFATDLLYRGQTGKKTLYKTLQVVVSVLCFVVAAGCSLGYDLFKVWFALHLSRLIYCVFRRRLVKHNALLSFHAMVFYFLYLLWEQLQTDPTEKQQALVHWFILFDLCGAARDLWSSPRVRGDDKPRIVDNRSRLRIASVDLLVTVLWISIRIVYFGYSAVWHSEAKTFTVLYGMIWLAQGKPAVELVRR